MHTHKEQKVVRLFMITLCVGIVLVYVLLFQVKGNMLQGQTPTTTTSGAEITVSIKSGDQEQTLTPITQIPVFTGTADTSGIQQSGTVQTGSQIQNPLLTTTSSTSPKNKTGTINILSGTNVFYGKIEVIDILGIKYAYALIDTQGTYFINLGIPTYDFASIARNLQGTMYELKTEADIQQNKLFGSKVSFINLPQYKDKKVTMIITLNGESRLIRMDYAKYHKSKSYLKSLFIQ